MTSFSLFFCVFHFDCLSFSLWLSPFRYIKKISCLFVCDDKKGYLYASYSFFFQDSITTTTHKTSIVYLFSFFFFVQDALTIYNNIHLHTHHIKKKQQRKYRRRLNGYIHPWITKRFLER